MKRDEKIDYELPQVHTHTRTNPLIFPPTLSVTHTHTRTDTLYFRITWTCVTLGGKIVGRYACVHTLLHICAELQDL